MFDYWDINDLYKALTALCAGVVLGLEREMKDKAAGLKTITLITLGSALFAIISYTVGQPNNEATRIASYVVSGIGFLGAGVIFKDGVNVSGLTTASVIWLASAVGLAIGFGEAGLAVIFLSIALCMIYFGNWFNKIVPTAKVSRMLMICLDKDEIVARDQLVAAMSTYVSKYEEKKFKAKEGRVYIYFEITIRRSKLQSLEDYLIGRSEIVEFEL